MQIETPVVADNEVVLRQISPGGNPIYYEAGRRPLVHQAGFLPSHKDTDGLSLIRSRFRSLEWSAYRKEQPDVRYRLALLEHSLLRELATCVGFDSFAFSPTPDELDNANGPPLAHCVADRINRRDYNDSISIRKQIKEWALAVANAITEQTMAGPFRQPKPKVAYRPGR